MAIGPSAGLRRGARRLPAVLRRRRRHRYESFSTSEEIEARHRAKGEPPRLGYDGYDRHLTDEQRDAFRAEGRRPVLRMRMPEEDIAKFGRR